VNEVLERFILTVFSAVVAGLFIALCLIVIGFLAGCTQVPSYRQPHVHSNTPAKPARTVTWCEVHGPIRDCRQVSPESVERVLRGL
jgi:hypothetical protein